MAKDAQPQTILLVEDEALIAMSEARQLQREGYAVVTAYNGKQAIAAVQSQSPPIDLILMDIDLGRDNMDGAQAAEAILQGQDIPVVFFSSHTECDVVEKTEKITSYGYVVKGSSITVLAASIKMAFKLHAAHQALQQEIAERKQVEETLRKSETRYRVLFETVPIGITLADTDGQIIASNPAATQILGLSPEEHERRKIDGTEWRIIRPDGTPMPTDEYASMRALKEQQTIRGVEMGVTRSKEDVAWISVNAAPVPDVGVIISYAECTEHKQAETQREAALEQLRQSEANYHRLMEQAVDAIVVTDAQGNYVDVNAAACTLLGYSRSEFLSMAGSDMIAAADLPNALLRMKKIKLGKIIRAETSLVRKDGTHVPVEFSARQLEDGRILAFVSDITERKQMEEALQQARATLETRVQKRTALRASQATLQGFFDSVPFMMGIAELDGEKTVVVSANHATTQFLGIQLEDLPGKTGKELGNPEDLEQLFVEYYRRCQREGAPARFEYEYPYRGGRRWLEVNVAFIGMGNSGKPRFSFVAEDITERKNAEAAIAASETRYRELANAINDTFAAFNRDWIITYTNEYTAAPLGITPQDMIGKNVWQLFPNLAGTQLWDVYHDVMEHRETKSFQSYDADHKTWHELKVFPSQEGIVVLGTDITERKRADEKLRESEERFRFVLDNSMDAAYRRNLQSDRYDYISPVIQQVLGWSAEEMDQMDIQTVLKLVHPDDRPAVTREIQRTNAVCLSAGRATGRLEYRFRNKQGKYHWVGDSITVLADTQGQPLYRLGVVRDISERKWADEALRQSEEKYRHLFENMAGEVHFWQIIRDKTGNIQTWRLADINPAGLKSWGKTLEETIGKTADEIFPGATEHFMPIVQKIFCEGKPHSWETYFPLTKQHLQMTSVPFGEYFITTGIDVTNMKQAEVSLRESEKRLKTAQHIGKIGDWEWIPAENRATWSDEMYEIFGIPKETTNLSTEMMIQAFHPDDRAMILEATRQALETNQPQHVEGRVLKPDGNVRYVTGYGVAVLDEKGQLGKMKGIFQDITERKLAENQIKLLAKLPSENPNPVLRIAKDGLLLYMNEAGHAHLSEWKLKVGKPVPPRLLEAVSQSMREGTAQTLDLEHSNRLYSFYIAPIVSGGYANLYSQDITESRQVKALQEAQARYLALFEQSPYGIILGEIATGNVIEANEIAGKQLGYSREELIKLRISDFQAAETPEQTAQHMQKIINEGGDDFETLHRTKNGEIRNARVSVKILELGGSRVFYAIVQDITARKQMEEANAVYNREITLMEERQRISSDLHDAVSQTLFSARLATEMLLRQPDRSTEAFKRSLSDLHRLIRSANGEIRLILVELRNNALLNVSLENLLSNLLDSGMAHTNANLVFHCLVKNPALPHPVKLAFYRIAQEAINNAIKHGKPNNIECTLRESKQALEMIIKDDGRGFLMSNVNLDEHFGLQIMRERAGQAGVKLEIESQPGKGTSIWVHWKKEGQ